MIETIMKWTVVIGEDDQVTEMGLAASAVFEPRAFVITARTSEGSAFEEANPGWAASERLEGLPFRYLPGNSELGALIDVPRSHLNEPQTVDFEVRRWGRDAPPAEDVFDIMILTRINASGFEWTEYLEGVSK